MGEARDAAERWYRAVESETNRRWSIGRISYHHAYWDNAAFMMQLGLMPPSGG